MVGLARGVSGIAGADRRVVSNLAVCVLGEPHPAGCPGPDRPEIHRYSSGVTSWCATHCSGSGCGNTRAVVAAASLQVRGEFRGPGRRIAAALGRDSPAAISADLRGDVAEQGEAVGEVADHPERDAAARGGGPLGVGPLGVGPLGVGPLGVGPLGVGPLGVGPLGGGQGPDTQRRPCAALLLPLPRQAPRRRVREEASSLQPDRQEVRLQDQGVELRVGRVDDPAEATRVRRLRTSTRHRRAGTRARGGRGRRWS